MADFDMAWDRVGQVRETAVSEVKEMLEQEVNQYQAPSWLQAAEMLTELEALLLPAAEMGDLDEMLDSMASRWDQESAEHWSTQWKTYVDCLARMLAASKREKEVPSGISVGKSRPELG